MEEIKKCPECESTNLIHDYDTGEIICGNCGLVVRKQMMDEGPEWRAFTDEEKAERSRVGMPISYSVHDKGLSTAIGELDRDASGKKIPLSTREQMWRLKKWQTHSRVHSSTERNLAQAMAEIDRLSDKVSLPPPIKEKAAIIYRKVLEKDLVQGRSILAMAAAALYAACRESKIPRTLREIAKESLVEKKDVARCYRLLLRKLEMQMPIADPVTFVSKIAEKVGISAKTQGLAIEILRKAKEKQISNGKNPNSLAAGALYIACLQNNEVKKNDWYATPLERKTQQKIAEAAGVTEVTIRNRYKKLKEKLGIEI